MNNNEKLVVLLHGWLGRPGAFGRLPEILSARGHDVQPLFHQFDSWPRGVTIENLAERLEAYLERERRGRPTVLIAHSMGGLVAMAWMLRYHAEKGRRPPVERLVTFGTPRHGVRLRPFARAFIKWGLVPGTAIARQMLAPNPFLWHLAWSELRHVEHLPPILCGAGMLRRANPVSALVGGRESDGVVPTICSQPNTTFVNASDSVQTLPPRAFHVYPGRAHNGMRGLFTGLQSPDRDERTATLIAWTERPADDPSSATPERSVGLRQALCVVRHRPGERVVAGDGDGIRPLAVGGDRDLQIELSLFLFRATAPGGELPSVVMRVGSSVCPDALCGLRGGSVRYIDRLNGPHGSSAGH